MTGSTDARDMVRPDVVLERRGGGGRRPVGVADVRRPVVGVLVISFQAASTIESVLDRLPAGVPGGEVRVLVADDASADATAPIAAGWVDRSGRHDIAVVCRPHNLGYGGNQVAGFRWAIEQGFDAVVVVHGDGQYPPERVADLVEPILTGTADAVFGSRMLTRGSARAGGMPLQRFVGNRMLSAVQNMLTGERLSEWHSGLRAYRVASIEGVDLASLPRGFDFDTAITLRLLESGASITEIPIATRYAEEVSYIDLYRTGARILRHTLLHAWARSRGRRDASGASSGRRT